MIASILAFLARLVGGSSVLWTEEPSTEPRIYIANHSSHLDFILLWSFLPPHVRKVTRPVAAKDYWSSGVRRYLADKVFKALLIDRGAGKATDGPSRGLQAVEQMSAALHAGNSLILFPEGTRGTASELAGFRSGLYFLCKANPTVPLVPVYMKNLNRMLPKGALIPVPLLSRITAGAPICLEEGEAKATFLERARNCVMDMNR